ncbi:MAG: hypothetical protein KAU20_03270 [Nanoarchaeota archaeon]|nr:hypothetical protein [Nanoarchaeota archaeon]
MTEYGIFHKVTGKKIVRQNFSSMTEASIHLISYPIPGAQILPVKEEENNAK